MKIVYLVFVILFAVCCCVSCDDEEDDLMEGEVLSVRTEKCACCPGYLIVVGSDTIKTESGIVWNLIGLDADFPIPVYLELGAKDKDCSDRFANVDFYEVSKITLRERE